MYFMACSSRRLFDELFSKLLCVIFERGLDDLTSVLLIIHPLDRHFYLFAGDQFVRTEVVAKSLDKYIGKVSDLCNVAVVAVVVENAYDLIVSFPFVDHVETANHSCVENDFGAVDGALAEYADVERVTVASVCGSCKCTYSGAAIGSGDKPVERRWQRGASLGSVDTHIAGSFIDLIFDGIERGDFDKGVYDLGLMLSGVEAVPGMWTPSVKGAWKGHFEWV